MYERKVQKTGGSTYFVTLPKGWAEGVGIKPGVVVTLMPNDSGSLLLVPGSLSRVNRCAIELKDWDFDRFQREIISRYIVGYDIIEIRRDRIRPEQRRMMREIAHVASTTQPVRPADATACPKPCNDSTRSPPGSSTTSSSTIRRGR